MVNGNKTISKLIREVAEDMCNNYCKYPDEYTDEDKMYEERCNNCPLNKL